MPYRTLVCGERWRSPGFPGGAGVKESACQCRRYRFDPRVGKIPWRRKWKPTSVFLPGKFHGRRATVHRITKSQTQLNTHSCTCIWGLQPQPLSPLLAGWCLMSIKPLKSCYPQQESPQAGVKAPSELISDPGSALSGAPQLTWPQLQMVYVLCGWSGSGSHSALEYQLEDDISCGCRKYNFIKVA